MTRDLTRRLLLAGGASALASSSLGATSLGDIRPVARNQARARNLTAVKDLIASRGLSGQVGCVLMDPTNGEILDSHLPSQLMPPASVTKAITAAYGLSTLGPNHRFATRLRISGEVVDGVLQGDIQLLGSGDPTLDTDDLVEMAKALKAAGIWDVKGRFLVSDGGFPFLREIDPMQPPQVGYNPAVSGVNLNFNRIRFDWTRRKGGVYDMSMRAAGEEYRPYIPFSRIEPVARTSPNYTHRLAGDGEVWTVRQSALGNKGGRWLPTRIPRIYAGEALRGICRTSSIVLPRPEIDNTPLAEGRDVHMVMSDIYRSIAKDMLKFSTNLTAEVLGFAASGQKDLPSSAAALSKFAQNNGMVGAFADHSGLSENSQVTALGLARFMTAQKDGDLRGLLKQMPLKENDNVIPGVSLQAKTGTLNFVSALSGYLTFGTRTLTFGILTADLQKRSRVKPEDRERPDGGAAWARRSRSLQYAVLRNWLGFYA